MSLPRVQARWPTTSSALAPLLIGVAAVLVLRPVLRNGFLVITFDDGAFILDNPYLQPFSWAGVWACVSRLYFHDYVPLPLLSYLLEFQLWGLDPVGYHLTNLLLHVLNSILVYQVSRRMLTQRHAALLAGLVFALHPVQLEVVSLIAQRKTLLATGFLLAALLAYQRYSAAERSPRWYAASWLLFVAACASKASVMPFPLLLLYDYTFQRRRLRLADKLPFAGVALATLVVSVVSKADVALKSSPQGGSHVAAAAAMSRVMWEYVAAMLCPLNLSPSYYYAPGETFSAVNGWAALMLVIAAVAVVRGRERFPLTFFCAAWVAVSLLPVANIVPIAVLRADRYLYLPMVAFAVWAGWGLAHIGQVQALRWVRPLLRMVPVAACMLLGVLAFQYAGVWRSDVTAWTRVVERHPWNARAYYLLALAYADREAWPAARNMATTSVVLDPRFDRPHRLLADIYRRLGDEPAAQAQEQLERALSPAAAVLGSTAAAGTNG